MAQGHRVVVDRQAALRATRRPGAQRLQRRDPADAHRATATGRRRRPHPRRVDRAQRRARSSGPKPGPGESSYTALRPRHRGRGVQLARDEAPQHRGQAVGALRRVRLPASAVHRAARILRRSTAGADIPMPDRCTRETNGRAIPISTCMRRGRPYDEGFTGPDMVRQAIAAYLGSVSYLDHNVGRVLAALEARGSRARRASSTAPITARISARAGCGPSRRCSRNRQAFR